jgi:hypothetical protein
VGNIYRRALRSRPTVSTSLTFGLRLEVSPLSKGTGRISGFARSRFLRHFRSGATQLMDGSLEAVFRGLSLNQLTEFIVIDLELLGTELKSSAVTRISIRGMPVRKVRENSALLSQLKSSDDLVRYLALLLADDPASLTGAIREQRRRSRKARHQVSASPVAIFETLLRGLAGNPQMFDELEGLLNQQNTIEGAADFLTSEAFLQIWEPFCQARKQLQTL